MSGFLLSDEAQDDLKEIKRYTVKNWGNNQARQYLIELTINFEKLSKSTKLGRERKEIDNYICSFCVNKHIVFYRKKPKYIEIVRVLHVSMDINEHL